MKNLYLDINQNYDWICELLIWSWINEDLINFTFWRFGCNIESLNEIIQYFYWMDFDQWIEENEISLEDYGIECEYYDED